MMQMYFSPYGRVSRKSYWLNWILPYLGISIVAAIIDVALGTTDPETGRPLNIVAGFTALALLWPNIAMTTKRLHDRGLSGWWQVTPLLFILPASVIAYLYLNSPGSGTGSAPVSEFGALQIIGAVAMIAVFVLILWLTINVLFLRGQAGQNKYGDDPLLPSA